MKTVQIVLLALVTPHAAPGQTVQRPPITGIAYVRIYAKDPAASRRFYTEELRLPAAPCPTEDCTRYQVGADQFIEVVRTDGQSDGQQLIAFRTTDAEALRRYLAARKVHVPAVARQRQDGSVEFAVADAERHGIAFIQLKVPAAERGVISHRLIHAGVVVHDRAAMDSLYIGILGFRPYWHGGMKPERTDWVSLQVPDGTDWLEYMLNVPRNASHHLMGIMNHLALGVEDMDSTEAALRRTGWQPHREERKQMGLDGKYQLNVFDPDEVRVEFMSFTPSRPPCCSAFTGPHPHP